MAFSRHTSRIYMEPWDIQGAVNVLGKRLTSEEFEEGHLFYVGAMLALSIIAEQEEIRTQADFVRILDVQLYEYGFTDELMEGKAIEEV